ncbi:imidazole glycerol phosphate synthase subunit HisH [Paremcibacter congregatus]|uniref:Imidazole glycerol phosphate synthase subunit HisH n=1 Tax=Paremcibacter congregatus TaxID=2043170 RepID=A0A2G4YRD5_9PROT|nr:imidazole glycerol phosphate synthase subunit HisH [Paremcibacter congregatus]PHZ84847.1 imidazole glycerol phosphate synthase subunit HisH [Paremcibacter congregatus]QDE26180.1 imidazole glycerol phosphate synthase subunit HisH [Paremcibacter congregatus]
MIAIVDYGIGNLGSIANMLKKVGAKCYFARSIIDIKKAEKIILPGVGHFSSGMKALQQSKLIPVIEDRIFNDNIPILGICLGMQLMSDSSEESNEKGLGWIPGKVKRFSNLYEDISIRVPHMGWNRVEAQKDSPLINDFEEKSKFYFVHSYYYECKNQKDVLLTTQYGVEFASAIQKGNIMGAQFHPEKSHKYGMKLMKNFSGLGN